MQKCSIFCHLLQGRELKLKRWLILPPAIPLTWIEPPIWNCFPEVIHPTLFHTCTKRPSDCETQAAVTASS